MPINSLNGHWFHPWRFQELDPEHDPMDRLEGQSSDEEIVGVKLDLDEDRALEQKRPHDEAAASSHGQGEVDVEEVKDPKVDAKKNQKDSWLSQ